MRGTIHPPVRLVVIIPFIALTLIFLASGITQARTNTYDQNPGSTQYINSGYGEYTFTVPGSDYAAGSQITDVNITVTFYRTNGTNCSAQGGPSPNQIYMTLYGPNNNVVLVNGSGADTTYGGGGSVNQVSVTFDNSGAAIPHNAMPATGTFHPSGTLSNFNAENPVGTWTLRVGDQNGNGSTCYVSASLQITAKGTPTATAESYTIRQNNILTVSAPGVLGNDADPNGDPLTATRMSLPSHGSLTFNSDGSFVYTPNAGYSGPDSFTYQATNGSFNSGTTTVSINVQQNSAPVANNDTYTTLEDTPLSVLAADGILFNDTDANQDPLAIIQVSSPSHGTLKLATTGAFDYTPDINFAGEDSFTYKVNDGLVDSNIATVTINVTPVNDAPVAFNDTFTTPEDGGFSLGGISLGDPCSGNSAVLGNDTDPENDPLTAILVAGTSHGQINLSCNGSISYIPNPNFYGIDTATYKANDGAADSNIAMITITVTPMPDPPVGYDDLYTTNEDTPLVTVPAAGVLANDNDPDGDSLTATLVTGPAHGTLDLSDSGGFTYTPDANYNGTDSFTYKANDGTADSAETTATIIISSVNDLPVAADDTYTTSEDTPLSEAIPGVLGNDTDADGFENTLHAILIGSPANGSVSLYADGSFLYTPNPNFNGADQFTYKANDGAADSNIATVYITISPVNDAPVAAADAYATSEDIPLAVPAPGILGNDSDIDGNPLSAALVNGPLHGQLSLVADGSFFYTPDANFNGADSFSYHANDGALDSSDVTVTITVNPVNDPPVAVNDVFATDEDTPLVTSSSILDNDPDIDGGTLSAILVSGTGSGVLVLNADGTFSYAPNTNFNGTDQFTYKANDGAADSNVATVFITVNSANDAPAADNDAYIIDEDTTLTEAAPGVLFGDTDLDGDVLAAILVTGPAHGVLTLNPDGSFSYQPGSGYNGADAFTYKASDGRADSNVATVDITVNPVNDAPVAGDDSYSTQENVAINTAAPGVLANDSDSDSPSISAVLVTGPAHGSLALNSDGSFTYTPTTDYIGPDSFIYQASDGTATSNSATVSLTVSPVNHAPVANGDSYAMNEDGTLTVAALGVLGNDTDVDLDTLSAVLVSGPANGALTLNPDGSFSYTPTSNYNGSDSFSYKANDGALDSGPAVVNITIAPQNDAPVASDNSYSTVEDAALNIGAPGVLDNDTDTEGDPLSAALSSAPANGSVTLNPDGSFTYTPNANFNGSDSFTYKANDGAADSSVATVSITVGVVNDPPTAGDDAYSTDEDTPLTIGAPGVLGNDSDPEVSPLSAILVSSPAHGTLALNGDGSFTYTPEANYGGADSFTYKANDGASDSSVATVTINVATLNDPPTAGDDSYSTGEDTALTVSAPGVLDNDSDPESSPLTAILGNYVSHGTLTFNADGSFSYTPDANFTGIDSFTYQASDGSAQTGATVTINVGAVNDGPQAVDDTYNTALNGPLTITAPGVIGNDTDPENDALTAALASDVSHGTLLLNADGSFSYTPDPDYAGVDSFTYTASDGATQSQAATVMINVSNPNIPQSYGEIPGALYITGQNMPSVIDGLGNNPGGDPYNVQSFGETGHGTLEVKDGQLVYTPEAGYYGEDGFSYEVTDSSGNHYRGYARIIIWKPVPTCRSFDGSDAGAIVYASMNDGGATGPVEVYCRTVVANSIYERNGGEIGIQSVIDLGIIQAVEIFGLTGNNGQSYVGLNAGATLCLRGTGHLIFLDAVGMPRVPTWLDSWAANGFTCANLSSTGTLILVP